jgi:hypothetical protein
VLSSLLACTSVRSSYTIYSLLSVRGRSVRCLLRLLPQEAFFFYLPGAEAHLSRFKRAFSGNSPDYHDMTVKNTLR